MQLNGSQVAKFKRRLFGKLNVPAIKSVKQKELVITFQIYDKCNFYEYVKFGTISYWYQKRYFVNNCLIKT